MATWLRKTFIRNYDRIDDPKVRSAHGVLSAWLGIFLNLILFSLKFVSAILLAANAGWVFSLAILGDSLNNLFDFTNNLITLIGFSLAKKPADEKHPFGHERAEYIAGLLIGVAILLSAAFLLYRSITGIVQSEQVSYDLLAFIALGATLPIKAFQSYVNFSFGKLLHSDTLRSIGMDSLIDAVVSTLILVFALIGTHLSWPSFDAYLGALLALFLGYNGVNAIRLSIDSLLGSPIRKEFVKEVEAIALSHEGVKGVHDVLCHNYGEDIRYVSLHVELDGNLTLNETHAIIDAVENDIQVQLHASALVHPDPHAEENGKNATIAKQIKEILASIDENLTFHDLQIKKEGGKTTLSFDVLLPYSRDENLEKRILDALKVLDEEVDVTFDHPMTD